MKWISLTQHRRITELDIALFLRQFATLISAGIPIIKSCEILEHSQIKTALRLLIYTIKRDILSGKDLFSSLQQHHYFDPMTCHLIKIGETTGKLDTMLILLADNQEKKLQLKKRVKHALIYPTLIVVTAMSITFIMLYFVVPQFAELFAGSHMQLPTLTRCIFYLSASLRHHTFIFTCFLLILPIAFACFSRIKTQSMHVISTLPFIYAFLFKILLAHFARNLATLFAAGIPITESLTLITHSNQPHEFIRLILKLRNHLASGLQLHQAMTASAAFPNLMIQMVKIGEESGMLEHLLNKTANFFEADIEQITNRIDQLLEPLIMLVLGVLIGGLVIGMYLPIFKLGSAL